MNASNAPEKPAAERGDRGRFGKGNPGGPGNPFARRTAELRKLAQEIIGPRLPKILNALMDKAEAGDVAAIKIACQYGIGKPVTPPDPDRVDVEEWKLIESMVTRATAEAVAIDEIPAAFATELAELNAKLARLELLFPSPEGAVEATCGGRTPIEQVAHDLDEWRIDSLSDPRFRQRWNADFRRDELKAATKPFMPAGGEPWAARNVRIATPDACGDASGDTIPDAAPPSPNGPNGGAGGPPRDPGPGGSSRPPN